MKGSNGGSKAQMFKDKTKNRVDDLQGVFTNLQSARKGGSGNGEVSTLEEQVQQMLREWKAELEEPSPASSLQGGSGGGGSRFTLSSELHRLLHPCEQGDEATSVLREPAKPKPEPDVQNFQGGGASIFQQNYFVNPTSQDQGFQGIDECHGYPSGMQPMNKLEEVDQLDCSQFDFTQDFNHNFYIDFNDNVQFEEDRIPQISGMRPSVLPPSAFLGPKCALWDCPRPAQVSEFSQDYCSDYHGGLALTEGPPGMSPILRPGGIDLKDGPLFAALSAKILGKDVGIPECEGAATTKSPWNAPELFDLSILEQETVREWLFFDKPRRAFESGNRKQRSLPDYKGRGWHESRKQVMAEFGGLKRSYYMDPQPRPNYEWHLFEYEINNCDACALYRLEFKNVEGKKSPKGKVTNDPLSDLQKQMGRLTAVPVDNKRSVKGRTKASPKGRAGANTYSAPNQAASSNQNFSYEGDGSYGYLVDNLSDYYEA